MKALKIIFKRSVWALATIFFAILFTILAVAREAVIPYEDWIDRYLEVRRSFLVDKELEEGEEAEDTEYFKTKYERFTGEVNGDGEKVRDRDSLKNMQKDALAVSKQVNDEGAVLLWNNDNALPLSLTDEKHVSTFGVHSLYKDDVDNWIYHGTGSANIDLRKGVGILEGEGVDIGPRLPLSLEKRGIEYNQKAIDSTWNLLDDKKSPNGYDAVSNGWKTTRKEVPWDKLVADTANDPIGTMKSSYNDAAIYVVGRYTGEGKSVETELNLTNSEKSVLKGLSDLRKSGEIKKLIVVITFANAMNMSSFKDYAIDACLWAGYGGSTATESVVDILWGNVNPSGHLVDTWVYNQKSAPASVNYGDITFTNASSVQTNHGVGEDNDAYVVYQEGIYVDYRYYETRYEDTVLGKGNAKSSKGVVAGKGEWSYGKEVKHPFGHGTSYTQFEYGDYSVKKNGSNYDVTLTVSNVGSMAGKDAVQIYLQKPYTDYDKLHGIEKASVELVGYAKTRELAAKTGNTVDSQTITISVPEYEFKTYDANGAGTYILEKSSEYYLAAGTDAHDALNNILAAKGKTMADGMDSEGNGELAESVEIRKNDFEKYSVSNGYPVQNRFDDADLNRYSETKDSQKVKYLSRKDWDDTYPVTHVQLTATDGMLAALRYVQPIENDPDLEIPVSGEVTSEYGRLNLIQLRGVSYGDQLWDDLLNQLTYEEQIDLLKGSSKPIESINAPAGHVYDGPCGYRDGYLYDDLPARCAFPCAPIVAATYNDELVENMATEYGELLLHYGQTGVWGISTNIHRLAYNGRNWEYFSADGFLSGKMTEMETKGLMSKGIIVYTKHFALNEQEIHRNGMGTWANEQTIREIYLKAFEAGITEANGNGMMTSYNRIGCVWTGTHKGLLQDVLRGEWGFIGVTATDWCERPYMGQGQPTIIVNAVMAGQDEWIYNVVGDSLNKDEYKNNASFRVALRESAHRNLYTRVNTSAMNFVGSNTRVVIIMPAWQRAIYTAEVVVGVIMGLTIAGTVAGWVIWFIDRRRKANDFRI